MREKKATSEIFIFQPFEDLKKMAHDAVLCHFEDKERPKVIRLHLVKEELLAV